MLVPYESGTVFDIIGKVDEPVLTYLDAVQLAGIHRYEGHQGYNVVSYPGIPAPTGQDRQDLRLFTLVDEILFDYPTGVDDVAAGTSRGPLVVFSTIYFFSSASLTTHFWWR